MERYICLGCGTEAEGHQATCCDAIEKLKKVLDKHEEKRDPVNGANAIFLKGWYSAVASIRKEMKT